MNMNVEVDTTEWDAICRVCLQEGTLHSIFDYDDENSELNIAEKVMLCSPIKISTDGKFPEQICTDCLVDLDVAYRFHKNCERSNEILQSFVDPSIETLTDDYIEQEFDPLSEPKDSRVLVSSETGGLYEYRPPEGLNVKLVKNTERVTRTTRRSVATTQNRKLNNAASIIVKSEILTDDSLTGDGDGDGEGDGEIDGEGDADGEGEGSMDILYEYDESSLTTDTDVVIGKKSHHSIDTDDGTTTSEIKPVRTNKVRLGYKSANKEKNSGNATAKGGRQGNQAKKENTSAGRYNKPKTNAKGEPKQPKKCEICGNTYMYQHALDSHMRRHRNEKPFKCSVCNKGFVINFELSRHMRTHTGQKPYACKYCDRRFSDFGSRVKHERIHTGERPYACATCGKTFAYSHVLSSHNLIHTGEKKYHCEICGKRFAKSHHLKAHLNTHNKHLAKNSNPTQTRQQQQLQQQQIQQQTQHEQLGNQQVYTLQVIEEPSQIDGDTDGDISDYLTQANIITTVKESGSGNEDDGTSETESQLLLYDVDLLDTIKSNNVKRKFINTRNGQIHEITIADHQDPIELLTFEDDELE